MAYPNAVYSTFAFISFLLVSVPFPWHLEAWNTGTCLYMAWTSLACLIQFINSVVWNGNAINWAPVWCDISSRLMVGYPIGILAASLCINRRLYRIACVKSATTTRAEKHRAILVDLAIGLGLPFLEMILQYIVQGHRFDIFEDVGCYPFTYNTPPAYVLVFVPPLVIGLVSGSYCVRTIIAFRKTQAQFREILSSNSNLNANRYFRLMCLAGTEVLCTVPFSIYVIYLNASAGQISPWISWADTHAGFSRVDQIPAILWRNNPVLSSSLEISRWLVVVCGFIFFAFFGFADEARKHYKLAYQSVAKRVGYSTFLIGSTAATTNTSTMNSTSEKWKWNLNVSLSGGGTTASLPIYVKQETVRKRDSWDTLAVSDVETKEVDVLKDSSLKSPLPFTSLDGLPPAYGRQFNETETLAPPSPSDQTCLPASGRTPVPNQHSFLDIFPQSTDSLQCIDVSRPVEAAAPRH